MRGGCRRAQGRRGYGAAAVARAGKRAGGCLAIAWRHPAPTCLGGPTPISDAYTRQLLATLAPEAECCSAKLNADSNSSAPTKRRLSRAAAKLRNPEASTVQQVRALLLNLAAPAIAAPAGQLVLAGAALLLPAPVAPAAPLPAPVAAGAALALPAPVAPAAPHAVSDAESLVRVKAAVDEVLGGKLRSRMRTDCLLCVRGFAQPDLLRTYSEKGSNPHVWQCCLWEEHACPQSELVKEVMDAKEPELLQTTTFKTRKLRDTVQTEVLKLVQAECGIGLMGTPTVPTSAKRKMPDGSQSDTGKRVCRVTLKVPGDHGLAAASPRGQQADMFMGLRRPAVPTATAAAPAAVAAAPAAAAAAPQ